MIIGSDPRSLAGRPSDGSRLFGQVLTPPHVARKMVGVLLKNRHRDPISLLDPAVGPGTFPVALLQSGGLHTHDRLTLYDIDRKLIDETRSKLRGVDNHLNVMCEDYLRSQIKRQYDLAILNPPYVRQEWLEKKSLYRQLFSERYGLDVPGTSNLYVYFLAKVLYELKMGGRLVAIVYDSWQFTKFGRWLQGLLDTNCDDVEIIPAGSQPFHGRLIDATIIAAHRSRAPFSRKSQATKNINSVHASATCLGELEGFKTIDALFHTKRGLRLKQANFFLCDISEAKLFAATPFVKKLGQTRGYRVPDNHKEAALLLAPDSQTKDRKFLMPELKRRLREAQRRPQTNVSILTWHRERPNSWYVHRKAPIAPVIFNYYLRHRPKHILNPSRGYADNFYGLTARSPTDPLILLALLNATCVCVEILAHGRNQGNGLRKVQLYEYRGIPIPDWTLFSNPTLARLMRNGQRLVANPDSAGAVIKDIDNLLASELSESRLKAIDMQEFLGQV